MAKIKAKRMSKFREKLDMYDMILASAFDKNSIVIPEEQIGNRELAVGFSCVASLKYVSKFYAITAMPDFVQCNLYSKIRRDCMERGVMVDFFTYSEPHIIDWNSSDMTNKLRIWKEYYNTKEEGDIFDYRDKKQTIDNKKRIAMSTKYLNESELDNRRTLEKVLFVIRITAKRDRNSVINMAESIHKLYTTMGTADIKIKELRINMMDWCRLLNPLSLIKSDVYRKLPKRVMTDDIEANFNSMRQGKVGDKGVPIGIDITSGEVVLYEFKEDPNSAENTLITSETGGGKSYLVKPIIWYLLASGIPGTIMDYEGDEYTNYGKYIAASNPDDVCFIRIGRQNEYYFDPCPIPELTGVADIDNGLKQMAIEYIKLTFQTMICYEEDERLTNQQTKVISTAIQRMYDSVGVTDKKDTWVRSKGLRLKCVYDEIKDMALSKEFFTADGGNSMNDAVESILEATSVFFEEGEVYAGTFGKPLPIDRVYKAKLVIFSFGEKGQLSKMSEKKILALKQISVAYINALISNNCKYVRKCFNFKVWEEGQRWLHLAGSSDIIINEITGGRKRGDINFIITNDIGELLSEASRLGEALTLNIQNYYVGKIPKKSVREKFCNEFKVNHILPELDKIANTKGKRNKYLHSFVLVLKNGSTPVVRAELPLAVSQSKIFQ